jgi:hypothetical protein
MQAERKWDYWIRAVHMEEVGPRGEQTQKWLHAEQHAWDEHEKARIENARCAVIGQSCVAHVNTIGQARLRTAC